MSALDEIGARLATGGIGTVGTDLTLNYFPETDSILTAVYEHPGFQTHTAGGGVRRLVGVRLQVFVRAATTTGTAHIAARDKAKAVHALLDFVDLTLSGTYWSVCEPTAEPTLMEVDDQGRAVYVANYDAIKEPS